MLGAASKLRGLRDFVFLFGLGIGALWIVQAAIIVHGTGDDWSLFWGAGHHVGSPELLTSSHFVYMPGAAWPLWLLSHFPRAVSYYFYSALMVCLTVASALIASRIYRVPAVLTMFMALAWWPLTIAVCLGQNSPIALFLATVAIFALVNDSEVLLGVATGAAFYKPTVGLPLVVLLLAFKQWRALSVVLLSLGVWFMLSAAATHDWLWPIPYFRTLGQLYSVDRVVDGDYSISAVGILIHMGLAPTIGWCIGLGMLLATTPIIVRAPRLESATMMPLLGLATTPHAYGYDALLALPMLWLVASRSSPVRFGFIICNYLIAPLYLLSRRLHFDALAITVIVPSIIWILFRLRPAKSILDLVDH